MMKRVVSFSLWGTSDIYLQGALDAVGQVARAYPGWECWFYLARDVPERVRKQLADKGARVLDGTPWGPWAGMYWRFLAAADPEVEIMISRDVDTLILEREVRAVDDWLASGCPLHIIRDHPKHEMPIMGGMWGCRAELFRNIPELISKWNRFDRYGCDQEFLARIIYPVFRHRAWIHSECIWFPGEIPRAFPTTRVGNQVIGMALRDEQIIELQTRYLREWLDVGSPFLKRPHPWSIPGRIRRVTRGRWPGESLPPKKYKD
jgi:hypothetical protein